MVAVQGAAPPEDLLRHCQENIGPPRVEEMVPGVWLAIGYDLASTIVVATDEGRVIIDTSMSSSRSQEVRAAVDAVVPGPVAAVIYTHSHIDHVGGASTWVEADTQVWATDAFTDHFFKQYGTFLPAETTRGLRQFGHGLSPEDLPCSALGRTPDITASLDQGVVLPTHGFSGRQELVFGQTRIHLVEAHGETHDQLFVWLPDQGVLLPGDNWYRSFPNLYTIRGSAPRPVDDWIDSLDQMRALEPKVLLPSHTAPVVGADQIQEELTAYRDAIQWVRDEVVRGANAGRSLEQLVADIGLPPHLAERDALTQRYGTVAWSVQAIHGNEMGWFDGKVSHLMPATDEARKVVDLAGGPTQMVGAIEGALAASDPAWAARLQGWLDADGRLPEPERDVLAARVYRALAAGQGNTNARAYLYVAATEREAGPIAVGSPVLAGDFLRGLPLEAVFEGMAARLKPEQADVLECIRLVFSDTQRELFLTLRHGVLEVRWGQPLPGTPQPVATLHTTESTWRALALRAQSQPMALASGDLSIEGDALAVARFFDRFDRELIQVSDEAP